MTIYNIEQAIELIPASDDAHREKVMMSPQEWVRHFSEDAVELQAITLARGPEGETMVSMVFQS